MSVIDNLIFDRTQADVDRVFELKNKILTGGGLSAPVSYTHLTLPTKA